MDQLWAIRKEFDPSRAWIAGSFLNVLRCTAYLCPYCRVPCRVTWGPEAAFLGDGERNWWRCKKKFWDGSMEWPEMSSRDRELFLMPISVAGWIGGTVVMMAIAALGFYKDSSFERAFAGLFIVLILLLPLFVWFGYRALQIMRSVRRFNERGSVRTQ